MNNKNKKKLGFIIGTTAMVANLGFSSMLLANAQVTPIDEGGCTASYGVTIEAKNNLDMYIEDPNEPYKNPVSGTSGQTVTGAVDFETQICASYASVSIGLFAEDFVNAEGIEIPIGGQLELAPQTLDCVYTGDLGDPSATNCTQRYINPNSFTPYTINGAGAQNITYPYRINNYDYELAATPKPYPRGLYKGSINFNLPIPNSTGPGTYTSLMTLTIFY